MKRILFILVMSYFVVACNDNDNNKTEEKYNPTPYEFEVKIPKRDFFPKIPADNPLTVEGVELGKKLFDDKILSVDNKLSCTSCHDPERAFANNERFNKGHNGVLMKHNTMSLMNLIFENHFGWTGAFNSLEDAIKATVELDVEFHENWDNVVAKLQEAGYGDMFFKAFGTREITADLTAKAIAQYIRSNISINSKFDKIYYQKRKDVSFTPLETEGYLLFIDERGDCFHCHRIGYFFDNNFHNNGLDANPEPARAEITGRDSDIGKYKTVTLRNIAITAPYMHDGRFKTLKEVLDFYSDHVQSSSPNLDPNMNHQGGITLNEHEKEAMIAFLKTLTDEKYEHLLE